MIPTYITFGLYLAVMFAVGIYFYKKASQNVDTYLLGGRGLGSWVTALSAQASDMSGWLLMGLPGVVYMAGINQAWVAIGLALGTFLNWIIVAPRLRIYTEKTKSLTLSAFFGRRFRDPTGILRVLAAIITLLFFTIYSASGLVASAKLFESMFQLDYKWAVCISAAVLLGYTILGGYLAVCWTDMLQGLLMFFALVIVPVMAFRSLEPGAVMAACEARNITFHLLPQGEGIGPYLAVISMMAWGIGYFGQPHIVVRFMSIKSVRLLPRACTIAMIWVLISLTAAVVIGILAIPMYENLTKANSEKVFIYMISNLFNPWLGGVLLAAIMAAIMSTIDSQLLVSSSTLTEDFYKNVLNRRAGEKELMHLSRFFVFLITVIAALMALNPNETIFSLVTFAWGGFGAAFGPVVLMALYSRKTTWQSALCGMAAGTVVMLAWYAAGLGVYMYEILPGFLAGLGTIFAVNHYFPQKRSSVLREFDLMEKQLKGGMSASGAEHTAIR